MNNLDASLKEPAGAPSTDWLAAVAGLDPRTRQVILYTADADSPATRRVLAATGARDVKTLVHVNPDDRPIKLGFHVDWQDAAGR